MNSLCIGWIPLLVIIYCFVFFVFFLSFWTLPAVWLLVSWAHSSAVLSLYHWEFPTPWLWCTWIKFWNGNLTQMLIFTLGNLERLNQTVLSETVWLYKRLLFVVNRVYDGTRFLSPQSCSSKQQLTAHVIKLLFIVSCLIISHF